jgi:hypothetical protein
MGAAAVYLGKGRFVVHAWSTTTDGVGIFWEPILALPEASNDRDLGLAIRAALDGSCVNVPHPGRREWAGFVKPLLKVAKEKSYKSFVTGLASIQVEEEQERVALTPSRNLGPKQGFDDDSSRQILLERGSAEQLGTAARRLLMTALEAAIAKPERR